MSLFFVLNESDLWGSVLLQKIEEHLRNKCVDNYTSIYRKWKLGVICVISESCLC